ncbi:MAG: glutamate--tRNA ligase [Thermovirgaceae bacterium]
MIENVRVRFAPSPTGALHIGGAHTALFNWLWARKNNGAFVLRIEDTDRARSTKEFEETIMKGLEWLGLDWDEGPVTGGPRGPYRQSERTDLYHETAKRLLDKGLAYKEGDAVIYSIPKGKTIAFEDIVYGEITMESDTLKDTVLIKSDGSPTYNFAVVVDDYLMGINCVIRGEDHISNTPKQVLLYEALDWRLPLFAHLPMILGKDKKKLSKRHGATSVYEYRNMGYLPEGLFNYFALLGWSPGDDREIFSREEALELFDLRRVTKRAAVFDMDKLDAVNQVHISKMDPEKRVELVKPFWEEMGLNPAEHEASFLAESLELLQGRGRTLREVAAYSDYFISFDVVKGRYDGSDLTEAQKDLLQGFFSQLLEMDSWDPHDMAAFAKKWSKEKGLKMKDVAMPFRMALTGTKVSPGIFEVASALGKTETARRLKQYGLL